MTGYMLRRLSIVIPVLFGITVLVFAFINVAPGDPVMALFDPTVAGNITPEQAELKREQLGLNDPLPAQYLRWVGDIMRGDFGYSMINRAPIGEQILHRLWPTLELTLFSLLIAILLAIPLGVICAVKQYSIFDYVLTVLSFSAVSIPAFFASLAAIYLFSLRLEWLPTSGRSTAGGDGGLTDHLKHLILPLSILTFERVGPFTRYVRASMLEAINQDYVTTARSKGLAERVVVMRHALRNVLTPLITIIGLSLPGLFGGVVIIETIFSWPGIGSLAIKSVNQRDYGMLMGLALISAIVIIFSNLIADICYAIADPRIRFS